MRRAVRTLVISALLTSRVAVAEPSLSTADWASIGATAQAFVARESPPAAWPFRRTARQDLVASRRKVFAHYMTPFPLSIEGFAPADDYYAREYLDRGGEGGKYRDVGGYLRERPLPRPTAGEPHWREIDLAVEIARAAAIGIDGFGVDLLRIDGPLWAQTQRLYDVATATSPDFRIVAEPDMASLGDVSEAQLAQALKTLLASPAAYRLADGRFLVVPFLAERRPPSFWRDLTDELAAQGLAIAILPDFLDPTGRRAYAPFVAGFTYWGTRDPALATAHPTERVFAAFPAAREAHFMAPVVAQDARPRDAVFWEARNTILFDTLWRQAIASRADIVHLITWNDYSESSEIAPSTGTQFAFYDLAAYFIEWFKRGEAPAIERDAILYTHRRQILRPAERYAPDDRPFVRRGLTALANDVEMLAFLREPATLAIEIDGKTSRAPGIAGLNTFRMPAAPGRPVFRLEREGRTVLEKTSDWTIDAAPDRQDPLYVGGSSTRPLATIAPR